ncbi:MAG: sulfite exporter TauE/SafE family protein [Gammaproteobacteria bacterium]|nr:sulfite exporter TauE/SafE family protein [Gammaproteobacteria bacterium]
MIEPAQAGAALLLGLAGAGHCLGMCGGIAVALQMRGVSGPLPVLGYHAGRVLSYAALGGLLGLLTGSVEAAAWTQSLRYVAAGMLIAMGLYVGRWWFGMQHLEKLGAAVFAPVQRRLSGLLTGKGTLQAIGLGLIWGLMPCGLIYSSLAWASTAQSAAASALLMLLFGIGTLPAMVAVSLGAAQVQRVLQNTGLKQAIGVLLILSGLWTGYAAFAHGQHLHHGGAQGEHAEHGLPSAQQNHAGH